MMILLHCRRQRRCFVYVAAPDDFPVFYHCCRYVLEGACRVRDIHALCWRMDGQLHGSLFSKFFEFLAFWTHQ